MRKILIAAFMLFSVTTLTFGKDNSLGLRVLGDNEISYQRNLGSMTRLELGLGISGFKNSHIGVSGMHQWVWNLSQMGKGFAWYAGVGAGVGIRDYDHKNSFSLSVLGQIGLEYTFNIPLRLSIDYRPGFNIVPGADFMGTGIALGVRYCF